VCGDAGLLLANGLLAVAALVFITVGNFINLSIEVSAQLFLLQLDLCLRLSHDQFNMLLITDVLELVRS